MTRIRPSIVAAAFSATIVALAGASLSASADTAAAPTPVVAVGAQYDSTHVYVAPADFDRFVASFIATFGGKTSPRAVVTVTPTASTTLSQLVLTPVGTVSVFGFQTPIPYPFGAERTGYLVTDIAVAAAAAEANGAAVVVAPFNDPIGKDTIVQWPGGAYMQLYWHTVAPNYAPLATVPENRIYVPPAKADEFIRDFLAFSHGTVESDVARAPGVEIGRPTETYRRVRIMSAFGKMTVLVTDGVLPYPYGRETTGYEVADLAATLAKAQAAGASVLVAPYAADGRQAAIVQFPGGYVAEIHAVTTR
jgi:predicted enzyme related to lactoylglutathione lyase